MHVHPSPINPNAQLNALYAAEKAAGKREAERTRKKLLESASAPAGEGDSGEDCVVRLGARRESQEQTEKQNQRGLSSRKKQCDPANSEDEDHSVSDWA
jgi:hypothetical protein